jgi:hypothetical protein
MHGIHVIFRKNKFRNWYNLVIFRFHEKCKIERNLTLHNIGGHRGINTTHFGR